MFTCPHCHKAIEIGQSDVPFWRRNLTPGLGCGSLLAIAFIVAICSGGFSTRNEIESMQQIVRRLSDDIREMQKSIDRLAPPRAAAEPPAP